MVAQITLVVLVLFGPRTGLDWPAWTFPFTWLGSIGGSVLMLLGGLLILADIFRLGANLTPVPYPLR